MQGVSEVIAIILILMITISLAGLAYMFMSTTMSDVTSSAGSNVDSTTSSMLTSFRIESMDYNILYIRNTGQSALTNLSVYVNDLPVSFNMTPSSILPGNIASVAVVGYVKEGDMVKVTSQSGFSTSKVAPDQCYGAIACWRFDEGYDSVAQDSSGNGNHGNLTGMNNSGNNMNGMVPSGWIVGRFGMALGFDGVNDHVVAGSCSSRPYLCFSGFSELTIAAWVYPSATQVAGSQTIIHNGFHWSNSQGIYFREGSIGNDLPQFLVGNGTNWQAPSSNSVSHNTWSHLVGSVKIGGNVSIYVNGMLKSTQPFIGSINQTGAGLIIGYEGATNNFNGTIDDVMIWNRVLSLEEIIKLYNRPPY